MALPRREVLEPRDPATRSTPPPDRFPHPQQFASPTYLFFGQILITLRLLHTKLVVHLLSTLTDVFALTEVIDVCEPFLGLPLGLSQNVLDLWVVLETEQSMVSWGLLLCPPPSNPSPRPRPIPHSQSPQVIWSRRSRHSAKLSLSSPGSPHETQVWPAQCDQSDQDILSCFLWKHTPGTFLPALTSATRSQVFPFRPGFL